MRWSYNLERSYLAAYWLAGVALLVFTMVLVGGATRLTGSGLSITEWRPVTGAFPPLSTRAWASEFLKYQAIPQYQLVNKGLSLHSFQTLYWWEWGHRLLARLVGAAILGPMIGLLVMRRIPRRLIWRCGLILALVALEGFVGWWMVASGLEARISVAPERLATHLCLALLIFSVCLWTALEAWHGRSRAASGPDRGLAAGSLILLALGFLQIMMGALVAGNRAGTIDTDWPLMGGRILPSGYAPGGSGLWEILAHTPVAVQFNHRVGAYLLFAGAMAMAVFAWRNVRAPQPVRQISAALAALVLFQAALGIVTLHYTAPLALSLLHQSGAVLILATAVTLAWRVQRN